MVNRNLYSNISTGSRFLIQNSRKSAKYTYRRIRVLHNAYNETNPICTFHQPVTDSIFTISMGVHFDDVHLQHASEQFPEILANTSAELCYALAHFLTVPSHIVFKEINNIIYHNQLIRLHSFWSNWLLYAVWFNLLTIRSINWLTSGVTYLCLVISSSRLRMYNIKHEMFAVHTIISISIHSKFDGSQPLVHCIVPRIRSIQNRQELFVVIEKTIKSLD